MKPFIVEPAECPILYSCEMLSGPSTLNLCDKLNGGNLEAWLDPETGNYVYQSNPDKDKTPPGDYTFKVTGSAGRMSDSVTFTITMID